MSMRMGRGGGPAARDAADQIPDLEWPATKPVFRAARVAPDGNAWVERYVAAGAPREYDVFGAGCQAQRQGDPSGWRRLVGFGKGVVYLREVTEDELSYLERYRLP